MAVIKSRKQGTSIVLTVPAEFKVDVNEQYDAKKLPDGTLQFVPVQKKFPEIWKDDPKDIMAFNEEIGSYDDGIEYGRENIEY